MRALLWLTRILILLVLLGFAAKNTVPVQLRFYFDQVWDMPLVMALAVAFAFGAVFGLLAGMGSWLRVRRELSDARRQVKLAQRVTPEAASAASESGT